MNAESHLRKRDTISNPRTHSLGADLNKSGVADTDKPSARSNEDFDDFRNRSNSASRQGYALWAQKMGLGKYDAGKVLFYHDEEEDLQMPPEKVDIQSENSEFS